MKRQKGPNSFAERMYRRLLNFYPREFRQNYGEEMQLYFRERRSDEQVRGGVLSRLRFWLALLVDLARTAPREHADILQRDLSFALRGLARQPILSSIAVLTLALGIGGSTAMFSVADGVLFRPLPYPESEQLAQIWTQFPDSGEDRFHVSNAEFVELARKNSSFSDLAAFRTGPVILGSDREPERLLAGGVTAGLWPVLGLKMTLGRGFLSEEDQPGQSSVVVLSHELWQGRFGGDRQVLGQSLSLDSALYTVVGVLPPRSRLPGIQADLLVPLGLPKTFERRDGHSLRVMGRLADGVSLAQARDELDRMGAEWIQKYDHAHPFSILSMKEQILGDVEPTLLLLLVAVSLVLFIACANVAALLLARSERRRREFGIRAALGAAGRRLVRQLLTESLLLAVLGGSLGVLLATLAIGPLLALEPGNLPRMGEIGVDGRVLCFAVGLTLLTGLTFGLAPAWKLGRLDVRSALTQGRTTTRRSRGRLQNALVVAEVALAVVLVLGTGLLVQSFWQLWNVHPGFHSEQVLTARISLPNGADTQPEEIAAFYSRLSSSLRSLPGVRSVGQIRHLPLRDRPSMENFYLPAQPVSSDEPARTADFQVVTPGTFATLGIPLIQGRDFAATDQADSPPVVILNETLSRRFFGEQSPLGQKMKLGPAGPEAIFEVIGIMGDVKHNGLSEPAPAQLFLAHAQAAHLATFTARSTVLTLRTAVPPDTLAGELRQAVWDVDRSLALSNLQTLADVHWGAVARPRFIALLLGLFSGLALLLALIGLYGVLSYLVGGRTREFGIRIALGASRRQVVRLVLNDGLRLVLLGLALGLAAAAAGSRLISGFLYQVEALDPSNFAGTALVLLLTGMGACWVPARRAARVEPLQALRHEGSA